MAVYQTELMNRERVARDTMAFWLLTDGCQYEFRAGQNADFVPANPLVGSTDIARTFSLASSPHDQGSIMIAMRMRVSEFKTTLLAAPNGTRFEASRARGSFTLHQDPQRPAVFSHGEGGHAAIGDHTSPIQAWRLRARTKAHLVSVFGCP